MINDLEYKELVLAHTCISSENKSDSAVVSLAKKKGLLDTSGNITYAGLTFAEILKLERL